MTSTVKSTVNEWDVYLGEDLIDTVYFIPETDDPGVYDWLVNHDKYDPRIRVELRGTVG